MSDEASQSNHADAGPVQRSVGRPAPERCADCDLLHGCREYCRCPPTAPPARGCHECAWGKVLGCWRCGSR